MDHVACQSWGSLILKLTHDPPVTSEGNLTGALVGQILWRIGASGVGNPFSHVRPLEMGMRRFATVSLLAVALLLTVVPLSDARGRGGGHHGGRHHRHHFDGRHHVFIGVGPWFWWDPYPYWWYYPPPYYYTPPVVVQDPPVYIQRPAPIAPPPEAYWYYCASAQAYYPAVQSCPEPWVKVPPRS